MRRMITYFPPERVHGPSQCFPNVFILWQLWITKIEEVSESVIKEVADENVTLKECGQRST